MPERIDFNDIPYHPELDEEQPVVEPERIDFNELTFGQRVVQGAKRDVSMLGAAAESAARGVFDNLMNVPNALGEVAGQGLAYPTAAFHAGAQALGETLGKLSFDPASGEPITPWGGFSEHLQTYQNTWPAAPLIQGYDAPTSVDLQAALPTAAMAAYQYRTPEEYGSFQDDLARMEEPLTDMGQFYTQKRNEALEGYIQRREEQPAGAAAGDVVGDVATMVGFRAPAVSAARARRLASPPVKRPPIDPGFRRFLERKMDDARSWARTSGLRLAETGLEGAFMAALQDEDAAAGAAFGVGMQAVGNATDTLWKEIPGKRPMTKVAVGAFTATALIQLLKSMTPGGRDRILESEESAFNKMAALVAVGALSQAAGFGRPSRTIQDDLGAIVDSWHSARRGAVMSLFSEIENDDSGDLDRVMTRIFEDPGYFDDVAMRRISHASTHEDVSLSDTIETLMESDRKFRRKLLALREQQ